MRDHFRQTLVWFTEALFFDGSIELRPSETWTDDLWFLDQDHRSALPSEGWWPLHEGGAEGRIVGGNLCTLNLLQGTPFMPALDGALLFIACLRAARPPPCHRCPVPSLTASPRSPGRAAQWRADSARLPPGWRGPYAPSTRPCLPR